VTCAKREIEVGLEQEVVMKRNVRMIVDSLQRRPFPVSIILAGIVVALNVVALMCNLIMM
jgi:hypothetical protein